MAKMQLSKNAAQDGMKRRHRKHLVTDVIQWLPQRRQGPRQLRLVLQEARD